MSRTYKQEYRKALKGVSSRWSGNGRFRIRPYGAKGAIFIYRKERDTGVFDEAPFTTISPTFKRAQLKQELRNEIRNLI